MLQAKPAQLHFNVDLPNTLTVDRATCQPTHAHTRVHPIIPIQTHLSGFAPLYPDG